MCCSVSNCLLDTFHGTNFPRPFSIVKVGLVQLCTEVHDLIPNLGLSGKDRCKHWKTASSLVLVTEATFTLSTGALLSIYLMRMATTVSKSFSYLSGCDLTAANDVDNLTCPMPFNHHEMFNSGSRPCHPCSMKFPRIIWYLTWQVTYFSQFHAFFHCHRLMSTIFTQLLMLFYICGSGLDTWGWWHKMPLFCPPRTYAV